MKDPQNLVTGGAGFIGSELTRQLSMRGETVRVIDNLATGRAENIADLPHDQVELEIADIRDEAKMTQLMKGVDRVFHLACLGVRHSIHSPDENHEVNAKGALNLLKAAKDSQVKQFICVSSSEVYGTALHVPMKEDHPTFPMTVYGAAKLAGEGYARAFYRTYGFPAVVVRPFNTYGPCCHHEGDSGEVIPKFMLRCMAAQPMVIFGDGKQTRDFIQVRDTARGIIAIGLSDYTLGHTINLGYGKEISINELAREIATCVGTIDNPVITEAPRPGDTLRLFSDNSLLEKLTSFTPEITLNEGLTDLKNWYAKSGKSPEDLLEEEKIHNWM